MAVLLAGCGGGGGSDGGDGAPPAVIAETAKDYWNAETDGRWAFVQTDSRPGHASGRINLVTIGELGTAGGTAAVRFVHSSLVIGWLEDRESGPSDRVRGTFVFPPAAR